jgi:hypothetical protein
MTPPIVLEQVSRSARRLWSTASSFVSVQRRVPMSCSRLTSLSLVYVRGDMAVLVFRDLRLEGKWRSNSAMQPVDENTSLDWMVKRILREKTRVQLQFWSHGLPGFVQCGSGIVSHPTAGPGISVHDLPSWAKLAGKVTSIEFHCCLVARIGTCPECGGHVGYDGNAFCFKVAQAAKTTVMASLHIQLGAGNQDCGWQGTVFTWNSKGHIVNRTDYPMDADYCADY